MSEWQKGVRLEGDEERRERNLALARYWREGGDGLGVHELLRRVKDVGERVVGGYRKFRSFGEVRVVSEKWERDWLMHNERLYEYGRRLVEERGGKI